MALYAPVNKGGKDFEPVPQGTHFAVCTGVFDVGLQPGNDRYPQPKRILHLRFEIPAERIQYEKDGQHVDAPAVIYERLTLSMGKKALMRAMVEGWYSMTLTDEQAAKVDIEKFAGRSATISISHNRVGDKVYANIATIAPLPKGMPALKPENEVIIYHAEKRDQYDKLPKFIKEKVDTQLQPQTEEAVDDRRAEQFVDDDLGDIPFN